MGARTSRVVQAEASCTLAPMGCPGTGNLPQSIASEVPLPGVWGGRQPWGLTTRAGKGEIEDGFGNQTGTLERFCRYVKQNLEQPSYTLKC